MRWLTGMWACAVSVGIASGSLAATKEEVIRKLSEVRPSAACDLVLRITSKEKTILEAAGRAMAGAALLKVQIKATSDGKTAEVEYGMDGMVFWMRLPEERGCVKADLSVLPEDLRKALGIQQGGIWTRRSPSPAPVEMISMEEKEKDGKKYYLLDVTKPSLAAFRESPLFALFRKDPSRLVKRIHLWVDAEKIELNRVEIAAGSESEEMEVTVEFRNWEFTEIPAEKLKMAGGQEVRDMTDTLKEMVRLLSEMKRAQEAAAGQGGQ